MYQKVTNLKRLKICNSVDSDFRSQFRRDYGRLIHCPSFRRLQGKTQLYPGVESDFFRNRLTHSLEVAQIAKTIALKLNFELDEKYKLDTDLVEFAGLAHDLGHPPFGHQGEEALDEVMINYGGFEGNAQTLRILTRLEKKIIDTKYKVGFDNKLNDHRVGLNLCSRTIASILKYDNIIPITEKERKKYAKKYSDGKVKPVKGYYESEKEYVDTIITNICSKRVEAFKSIECQIMDIADDIAYSTYDLEDGLKAGFYNPLDLIYAPVKILERVKSKVNSKIDNKIDNLNEIRDILSGFFVPKTNKEIENLLEDSRIKNNISAYSDMLLGMKYSSALDISQNGYHRINLTSELVGRFIGGITMQLNKECPALSIVEVKDDIRKEIEVLKTITYESQILSPKLKIAEFRGKEIVKKIFETLTKENGYELLPNDVRETFDFVKTNEVLRNRIICDYIAGMTDKYAIEFYGRLTSENPETIFKPF